MAIGSVAFTLDARPAECLAQQEGSAQWLPKRLQDVPRSWWHTEAQYVGRRSNAMKWVVKAAIPSAIVVTYAGLTPLLKEIHEGGVPAAVQGPARDGDTTASRPVRELPVPQRHRLADAQVVEGGYVATVRTMRLVELPTDRQSPHEEQRVLPAPLQAGHGSGGLPLCSRSVRPR